MIGAGKKKIIIYTQAYNAENTLKRSIDSVLNQTYENFIYYVMDNGSDDDTWKIIQSYSVWEKRIVPLQNVSNNIWPKESNWLDFLWQHDKDDFFCMLDSDDEYDQSFLEKMLEFINKYQLDIVACGNDFVNAADNIVMRKRVVQQDMIIEKKEFSYKYPIYHQFMRTLWGKLYPVGVLRHILESKTYLRFGNPVYGRDTLITQEAFREANRVGILSESLHKYYVSKSSDSFQFNNTRIMSDRILFNSAKEYLNSKCGSIHPTNFQFILEVYSMAIIDTMNVIKKSKMMLKDKLDGILNIIQATETQEAIERNQQSQKLLSYIKKLSLWIMHQKEAVLAENRNMVAIFFSELHIIPEKEICWETSDYLLLLLAIRKGGIADEVLDQKINEMLDKNMMLRGLNCSFSSCFPELIELVMKEQYQKVLKLILDTVEADEDIPEEYIEYFLDLGLNVSAKLESNQEFIYIKKLKIQYLMNIVETERAIDELSDWDEILPEDVDFMLFRTLLNK